MAYLWPVSWLGLRRIHGMLKAWFKGYLTEILALRGYLAEILALRDYFDNSKMTLNTVL